MTTVAADTDWAHQAPLIPASGEVLPAMVWRTLALMVVILLIGAVSMVAVLQGAWPVWAAVVLHTGVAYVMFTVLHDASHHALGRVSWVNAVVGRLASPFVGAHISFPFFRYVHLQHHRYANEGAALDPDGWASEGPAWQLPLRWLTVDAAYTVYWLRRLPSRPLAEVLETVAVFGLMLVLLILAGFAGVLWEVLMLVVLPQRLAMLGLACAFDYLPHHGLSTPARVNEYRATRNRVGWGPLMTPLLLSQNYHLVHHLYPSVPFYRYAAVWARHQELFRRQGAEVTDWCGRQVADVQPVHPPEMPNAQRLRISNLEALTQNSLRITLAVPAGMRSRWAFHPGQHLTVLMTSEGQVVRRCYSICSSVDALDLQIAIKRLPGGRMSDQLVGALRVGDLLTVLQPAGRFFLEPIPGRRSHYGAVAAGSGITPIIAMIQGVLSREPDSRFSLIYCNRARDDIMFAPDLSALRQQYGARLTVVHCLSQAVSVAGDPNYRGRLSPVELQRILEEWAHAELPLSAWYLCGPDGLMEVVQGFLDTHRPLHGHAKPKIHRERFGSAAVPEEPTLPTFPSAAGPVDIRVTVGGKASSFQTSQRGQTVLDAAMTVRLDVPYSCLGGACGTCRAKVICGEVVMAQNHVLSAEDLAQGYVLACQSRPAPNCTRLELDFDA